MMPSMSAFADVTESSISSNIQKNSQSQTIACRFAINVRPLLLPIGR